MQKSNAFVDQRFGGRQPPGTYFRTSHQLEADCWALTACIQSCSIAAMLTAEDDASLTAGDKAIARFQKQRMKELKGNTASPAQCVPIQAMRMKELKGAPAHAAARSRPVRTVLCSLRSSSDCAAPRIQWILWC